jgi:hypothetical protein
MALCPARPADPAVLAMVGVGVACCGVHVRSGQGRGVPTTVSRAGTRAEGGAVLCFCGRLLHVCRERRGFGASAFLHGDAGGLLLSHGLEKPVGVVTSGAEH